MLIFFAGLMLGGAVAAIAMGMMIVADAADRHIENGAFDVSRKDEASTPELSACTGTEPKQHVLRLQTDLPETNK